MKVVSAKNTNGHTWRVQFDGPIDGRFVVCDRLTTKPEASYSPDCGALLVLDVEHDSVTAEALCGWTPTAGHIVKRMPTCTCVCHR